MLDTTGYPKWCKACRAKYKRDYNDSQEGRHQKKGFAQGVTAMRYYLADQFLKAGSAVFEGYQLANIVKNCPGPKLTEEED
jgi:hypothetical protein